MVLSRREPPLPLEGAAGTSEKSASARAALVSATKGVKLGLVRVVQQGIVPLPARPEAAGQAQWRIARRSLSHLFELTYYRANGTAETALSVLVRVSGQRWVLEVGFEDAKDLIGPDQYEERKWTAWYRHITLPLRIHA